MQTARGGTAAWTRLGIPLGGLFALATFALFGGWEWDPSLVGPSALETAALDPGTVGALPAAPLPVATPEPAPDRVAVLARGETLGGLFAELGLDPEQSHAAAVASARYLDPRNLMPGLRLAAYLDGGGAPERIELAIEGKGELALTRRAAEWEPAWRAFAREARMRSVSGTLDGALEASVAAAGAPGDLAYALGEVLQWDLDFNRDLREGDRFSIVYEEIWIEGRYHGIGDVLAATYGQEPGRTIEAFRFADGYYDAEGRPLQKLFLRSPMPYSRVTSRFSHRRFHPVLGVFRPHHGVDYGAPVGTPVRATAAGTVVSAGWDGGGGKTVKIRHPNDYLTGYLHLSRFAAGVRAGTRVAQGEVIGYVGATGLATGPHLDYRVQHAGRWIDPLSLKSVPAEPLSRLELAAFGAARDALRAQLAGEAIAPPLATTTVAAVAAPRVSTTARR